MEVARHEWGDAWGREEVFVYNKKYSIEVYVLDVKTDRFSVHVSLMVGGRTKIPRQSV